MSFAPDLREAWLDDIETIEKWMALFSIDPAGLPLPATVEVVGDVYARQLSTWTRTGPTVLTLNAAVRFLALPPGTVIGALGAFDDAFGGTLVFSDVVLPEPLEYPSGGAFVLPSGEYELRID